MRSIMFGRWALALAVFALLSPVLAAEAPPPKIAVMSLVPKRIAKETVEILDDLVVNAIDRHGGFTVIGSADINAMLGFDRMKQALGCDDVSCAAEIGGALGVDLLLAGSVGQLGDYIVISMRLVDIKTATVESRTQMQVKNEENLFFGAVRSAIGELLEGRARAAPPPTSSAPVATADAAPRDASPGAAAITGRVTSSTGPTATPSEPDQIAKTADTSSSTAAEASTALHRRTWPWFTGGVAFAGAITAAYFGLAAKAASSNAESYNRSSQDHEFAEINDLEDEFARDRLIAYIAAGTSAALGIVTVVGSVTRTTNTPQRPAAALVPAIGPELTGAVLFLSWP